MRIPLTRLARVMAGTLAPSALRPTAGTADFAAVTEPSGRQALAAAAAAVPSGLEPLEGRTMMSTTYYVSPSGSDSNKGTSTSAPLKSLSGVNAHSFSSGDQVLLQGGQTFSGQIYIRNKDSGVTFGSYGTGRATISSGGSSGIEVHEVGGITVNNLNFKGSGSIAGLKFVNGGGSTLSNVTVNAVDVSGYGDGIYFQSGGHGWNNVRVTQAVTHNLSVNGINFHGTGSANATNVYVGYCTAYSCLESGYSLSKVAGATVEHSLAYNDGAHGSLGFIASQSNHVTFQYNVSHDNHTQTSGDGGGFDFDWDTDDSSMLYNYSYNNDGHGFQLNNINNGTASTGNTIRGNVSVNDARKHDYAGIGLWGKIQNATISDNYIQTTPSTSGGTAQGIKIHNATQASQYVSNVAFTNNTIVTSGGAAAINVTSDELKGASALKFSGGDVWAGGSAVKVTYGSKTYTSLSSWKSATGQGSGTASSAVTKPATSWVSSAGASGTTASPTPTPTPSPTPTPTTTPTTTPTPTSTPAATAIALAGSDIGNYGLSGSNSVSGTTYTVTGSGADIYGTADSFRFAYTTLSGDGQIVARVASLSAAKKMAKAGIMIRDDTSAGSRSVSLTLDQANNAEFTRRHSANGSSNVTFKDTSMGSYLKLVRSGNTFSSYVSSNGTSWTLVKQDTVTMNSTVKVGLAVTSYDRTAKATGVFDHVSVVA